MANIYIKSEHLQLAEPLMEKYYGYHPSMLYDEIKSCVETSGIDYKKKIDDALANHYKESFKGCGKLSYTIDFDQSFREHKDLSFSVLVPYKKIIPEQFSKYFTFLDADSDEVMITDDYIVYLSLIFMSYVYYKEKHDLFQKSELISDFNLEYEFISQKRIYPEIMSLYKMILESKKKKNRGSKVTISYKQDEININSCAWFLDDMEKYFKDRFPDLTLDRINELLPDNKGKAGRKFRDRIISNLIWGTYQLLYNHHSKFKNSKRRINKEICLFIIDYLDCLKISHEQTLFNMGDRLKDMIKRSYTPQWNLPWCNTFSDFGEKESGDILNTPLRRYNIYS